MLNVRIHDTTEFILLTGLNLEIKGKVKQGLRIARIMLGVSRLASGFKRLALKVISAT